MARSDYRMIRNMSKVVTWRDDRVGDKLVEIFSGENTSGWRLSVHENGNMKKVKERIKTRSQAIKSAELYMKNH